MGQTLMIARKAKGCLPIENKSGKIENYNIKCLSIVLFDITQILRTQDTKTKWVRMLRWSSSLSVWSYHSSSENETVAEEAMT